MPNSYQPKIVFLGTPQFAVPTLKALIAHSLKPVLVITQPDKPVGRSSQPVPSPVKQIALENNIDLAQPATKKDLSKLFEDLEVDVCILVAYGMILPEEVLAKPKYGWLNLHPSLLPKYRGASPIQSAILNGDPTTGITLMKISAEMDAGPIIMTEKIKINSADKAEDLGNKLFQLGAELIIKVLPDYLSGKIEPKAQAENLVTMTKMISKEDGQIDWQKSAIDIDRQFRAFYPWPATFTYLDKKRLKIANLGLLEGDFSELATGELFLTSSGELAVKCGDGAISLLSIQLEGKKEVSGKEFLNGYKDLVGKVLA